jgi:amidase
MIGDSIATWPAVRLADAIRAREFSSRELLDLYVDRIARLNPKLNAVVTLDVERARSACAAADDALARGDALGPLHGLPVTIKDAIDTEGIRSTGGATECSARVPAADAPAVARLRDAGAIVFGKTNLPRWSCDIQTYNDIFGTTNNPWALDRTPGGSSGGAAAAVAAGLTSFELGTDIGGSVRVPSHCCGVYGLKPSYGVVPQHGYLDHVGGGVTDVDINVFGPIARSADDLDLLLGVLAGPSPEHAAAWHVELPEPTVRTVRGCRVGLWLDDAACPIEVEYLARLRAAVDALADAGAHVADSHPPVSFAAQIDTFTRLITAAVSPAMPDEIAEAFGGSHRAWLRANDERAAHRRVWAEWFASHDVLLCPVNLGAAFAHDQAGTIMERTVVLDGVTRGHAEYGSWPGLIGVVGLPAAVVPIGRTRDGLPVGVQVVAPYLADRTAIAVAGLVGELVGGYEPPPLAGD